LTSVRLELDQAAILEPSPDAVVVEAISEYVAAYARLTEAIHGDRPLTLIVRHRACAAWFRRVAARYGSGHITVQEITRRARLAELWGVTLPDWVSEQDIERSGLLDLPPLRAQPEQSFEDVMLEGFYSPFLTYDRLPLKYLVDLLDSYEAQAWARADERPIAARIKRQRLAAWAQAAQSEGEQLLVRGLQEDPEALRALLCRYRTVQKYPQEVGERLLGQRWVQLRTLPLDLGNLRIDESQVTEAVDQIEVHLQGVLKPGLSREIVEQVLDQVSGCLVAEFNWVEQMLHGPAVTADEPLLDRVRTAFSPVREQIAPRLADLDLLVEPPRPSSPNPEWAADQWLDWTTREYLPFRFWLEEVGRIDEGIAGLSEMYADWLYQSFLAVSASYPHVVYRAILNSAAHLGADQVLLFIMMDNFNYKFFPDFQSMMEGRGYFCQVVEPYLSMLPSATEVSKKAMAVGQPQPFAGTSYAQPVENTWSGFFSDRRIKYLSYVGDINDVHRREHDIYILNYLPVDDALHSNPRQTGVSHAQAVRQCLRNLVEAIHSFALRVGIGQHLCVVICSDHGSTKIPADVPNIIDQAFYSDRVMDKHHRYVSISDEEMAALPENARFQCYYVQRDRFQLNANYLAARGYYRFIKTDENYYVHGGLTPEETIVPFAVFERVAVKLKNPTVRLLADELRYGVKSSIPLEVVNPNEQSLLDLRVEILSPNVAASKADLTELPGRDAAKIVIEDVRIRRTPEEMKHLELALAYEFAGRGHRQTFKLPVTMKTLMTTSFDLLDLD
jgi:hypothetical protein